MLGIAALLLLVGAAAGAGYWYKKKPAPVVETPPAPAPVVRPPARPAPAAFTPLFNGRDLAGWRPSRNSAVDAWAIQNGVLTGTQKPTDQVLLSDTEFADFELRLEYRWPKPGGHTVVLLRATDSANLVSDGLGINIGDDEGFPAIHGRGIGGLYRTGLVQGVTFNPTSANRAIGTWNELHVFAKKQTIEVKLNGVRMPTAELAGKTPVGGPRPELIRPAGSVGLVCHWGSIEFRNITIRPVTE